MDLATDVTMIRMARLARTLELTARPPALVVATAVAPTDGITISHTGLQSALQGQLAQAHMDPTDVMMGILMALLGMAPARETMTRMARPAVTTLTLTALPAGLVAMMATAPASEITISHTDLQSAPQE